MCKYEIGKMSFRLIIGKLNFNFAFAIKITKIQNLHVLERRDMFISLCVYIFMCTVYDYVKCKCLLIFHCDAIKEFSLNSSQLASNIRILPVAPSFPITENFSATYKR